MKKETKRRIGILLIGVGLVISILCFLVPIVRVLAHLNLNGEWDMLPKILAFYFSGSESYIEFRSARTVIYMNRDYFLFGLFLIIAGVWARIKGRLGRKRRKKFKGPVSYDRTLD